MVKLICPYMVPLYYPVNGGKAYAVSPLKYFLVFNNAGLNLSQSDGIISHHHIYQGSLLLSSEQSPPASNRWLPLSSAKITITDLWCTVEHYTVVKTTQHMVDIQSICTTTLLCMYCDTIHSDNEANYLFSLLKVRTMGATVKRLKFGWTSWPSSFIVLPCTTT